MIGLESEWPQDGAILGPFLSRGAEPISSHGGANLETIQGQVVGVSNLTT
jgi:hypothetical protein